MTDEGGERFHPPEGHSPWWRTLWSREPRGRSDRHIRQEQAFRRELLLALPRLRGHAMALTGAPDRADDLVQDTCERALARWRQYSGEGPLAAWLLRILHNRWHDRLRAEAVRAAEPLVEDGSATSVPSSAQDGAELAQILRAIAGLAADQRAALLLDIAHEAPNSLESGLLKRLGSEMPVPDLGRHGLSLLGALLLVERAQRLAQIFYRDRQGGLISLLIALDAASDATPSPLRIGDTLVLSWREGGRAYALVGEPEQERLSALATRVAEQSRR